MCYEVSNQIERIVEYSVGYLDVLSTNPILILDTATDLDRKSELVRARDALGSEITLLDADGYIIDSSSNTSTELRESSAWFRRANEEHMACISAPIKPPYDDRLFLSTYLPVAAGPGVQTAVIKATLPFDQINDILNHDDKGEGGTMMLLDANNNLLTARDPSRLLEKFDNTIAPGHWDRNREGLYHAEDGRELIFVAQRVVIPEQLDDTGNWTLLWTEDPKTLLAVVYKTYIYHAAAAFAALMFAILIGVVTGRRFAEPVVATSAAAQKAADGDFDIHLPDYGNDEFGDLGRAFNQMMEKLKASNEQVRRSLEERTDSLLLAESTMAQLRATYEAVGDGLLVVARDGKIVQMNSAFSRIFDLPSQNYSEMDVGKLYDWLRKCAADKEVFDERWAYFQAHPDSRCEELMATEFPSEKQLEIYTAPVRNTGSPEPFARLWIFRDKTEFCGLEEQLRQSQKMEAVGQLAGGIAHDFNNLLTGISGNLALALCKIEGNDIAGSKPHLQTAQGASERSAALVKQLLGYSRKSTLDLKVCDINEIVVETEGILEHTLDKKIKVSLGLEEELWNVEIDPNQMQQVVMNLCVNARDAIDGEGTITIRTQRQEVSEGDTFDTSGFDQHEPGDYIVISVADTGCGMTPVQQAKMFEPFFTTKEQGKGTGLGLAMCYGIVKQHGGWIACRSNVGLGTCFRIFLPRATKAAVVSEIDRSIDVTPIADPSQITILLADDEPSVRMVAESLLRRKGFNVHCADNGLEAVRISRDLGDKLDLAILDLTMPKLSGGEAFAIMSEEFPACPILICSGYMLDLEVFRKETGHAPAGFIQKPYKLDTMMHDISRVLGDRNTSASSEPALAS